MSFHWKLLLGVYFCLLTLPISFPAHAATSNWSATMTEWNEGTIIIEDGDMTCGGTDWYAGEVVFAEGGGFLLAQSQQGAGFPVTIQTDPTEGSWVDALSENCFVDDPCTFNVIAQCNDSEEELTMGLYDDTLVVDTFDLPSAVFDPIAAANEAALDFGAVAFSALVGIMPVLIQIIAALALIIWAYKWFMRWLGIKSWNDIPTHGSRRR